MSAHGEKLLLLSEEGNRKTNFAGCVNEQFEITNVTGILHDLDTKNGSELSRQRTKSSPPPQ